MKKVIVIGLDGATWELVQPLVNKGRLPNIKKIMDQGTIGDLYSTIPPVTGPAWVSFATGCKPEKHGVFDFMKFIKGDYETKIITSKDIKPPFFYELLGEQGKKCIIINLPHSYPPRKINGLYVGDWLVPEPYVYPKEKMNYLNGYRHIRNLNLKDENRIDDLISLIQTKKKLVEQIMKKETWDFFFILISATDWISHDMFINIMKKTTIGKKAIKVFEQADDLIGLFLKKMKKDDIIIIMSDHGFKIYNNIFSINKWLLNNNYLNISSKESGPNKYKTSSEIVFEKQIKSKSKVPIPLEIIKYVKKNKFLKQIVKPIWKFTKKDFSFSHPKIDLFNTKVWMPTSESYGLYINSISRFKDGIISKDNYLTFLNEIVSKLKTIKDPDGKNIFNRVESLLHNNLPLPTAPDIMLIPSSHVYVTSSLGNEKNLEKTEVAYHQQKGIFIIYGQGIKKSGKIKKPFIYDLAPTILHIFGLPIPNNMDGKVLTEIFNDGSKLAKSKVRYTDTSFSNGKTEKDIIKGRIQELKKLKKI